MKPIKVITVLSALVMLSIQVSLLSLESGKVIATSSIPFRSAEFGRDKEVQEITEAIFGIDMKQVFNRMSLSADVQFEEGSTAKNEIGYLNYIHKQKEGKDIYFITNTTENQVSTSVHLRGRVGQLELWNPHTGTIEKVQSIEQNKQAEGSYTTSLDIELPSVSSIFLVGNR